MADDRRKHAVDIVARHRVATGLTRVHYAEIGRDDWQLVKTRELEIRDQIEPSRDEFDAAYAYLQETTP